MTSVRLPAIIELQSSPSINDGREFWTVADLDRPLFNSMTEWCTLNGADFRFDLVPDEFSVDLVFSDPHAAEAFRTHWEDDLPAP